MTYSDAYISLYKMLEKNSEMAEKLAEVTKDDKASTSLYYTMYNSYQHVLHTMRILAPEVVNEK